MTSRISQMTRIKVCGMTRMQDVETALQLGVDAIGLVFYAPSPRSVTIDLAAELARQAGPFMTVVGLFVDPTEAEVNAVLERVPLHLLQFHGDEPAVFCRQFRRPWLKALRMKPELNLAQAEQEYREASGLLLDTYKPGVAGGTGEVFDWNRVPDNKGKPVILAGGLNPDNVGQAIRQVKPYAVDVSGGVESAPGKKDAALMKAFIDAAKFQ